MRDYSKIRNYRVGGILSGHFRRKKVNPRNEGSYQTNIVMETYGKQGTEVLMKLVCGPVLEHQDGLRKTSITIDGKSVEVDMCNKQITLNAQYGKPEDNSFALWTPSGTLSFSLQNPTADIFRPGKAYQITIKEWPE